MDIAPVLVGLHIPEGGLFERFTGASLRELQYGAGTIGWGAHIGNMVRLQVVPGATKIARRPAVTETIQMPLLESIMPCW